MRRIAENIQYLTSLLTSITVIALAVANKGPMSRENYNIVRTAYFVAVGSLIFA